MRRRFVSRILILLRPDITIEACLFSIFKQSAGSISPFDHSHIFHFNHEMQILLRDGSLDVDFYRVNIYLCVWQIQEYTRLYHIKIRRTENSFEIPLIQA